MPFLSLSLSLSLSLFRSLFFSWGMGWLTHPPSIFISAKHVFSPRTSSLRVRILMDMVYQNIQFGRQNYGDGDAKKIPMAYIFTAQSQVVAMHKLIS